MTDIVHTSIYVPKILHRKLRGSAIVHDCKIHDLILRGIQSVLLLDSINPRKPVNKTPAPKRKVR